MKPMTMTEAYARLTRREESAAIAFAASTDGARAWTGTLEHLASFDLGAADRELPVTVVSGEVVACTPVSGRFAVRREPQVTPQVTQAVGAR